MHRPAATISVAFGAPVWLVPRTTLGAPNTVSSPIWRASFATSMVSGNSAIWQPWR
ncbi:hypothetical protein D3C85_1320150 [compost metagenome]